MCPHSFCFNARGWLGFQLQCLISLPDCFLNEFHFTHVAGSRAEGLPSYKSNTQQVTDTRGVWIPQGGVIKCLSTLAPGVPGSTEVQLPTVIIVMTHFYWLLCPPGHSPPSPTSISWEHSCISYDPSDHVSGSSSGWEAQTKLRLLTPWLFALSFPDRFLLSCRLLEARGTQTSLAFSIAPNPPQNLSRPINSNQNHLLIHEYFQATDI